MFTFLKLIPTKDLVLVGIIIVLATALFLIDSCEDTNCPTEEVVKVDTIENRIVDSIPQYIPQPKETLRVEVPINVDTQAILKDYFSKIPYNDTIGDDTVQIIIQDTILNNRILNRRLKYNFKTYNINTTKITPTPKRVGLYWGAGVWVTQTGFGQVDATLTLEDKRDYTYTVGVGINNNLQPLLGFRFGMRIKTKKRR